MQNMSKKEIVNLGFIGGGFIAQQCHLPVFASLPDARMFALSDFSDIVRKRIGAKYNFQKTYNSHLDLLKDSEVDAVIIVVPRPQTAKIVYDSLEHGKHVLSEKPMCLNSTTGQKLLGLSIKNNLLYKVGYMKRFDSGVLKAKQIFDGLLLKYGQPKLVISKCYMGDSYCRPFGDVKPKEKVVYQETNIDSFPDWLLTEERKNSFGVYLNTFSHTTNLLRFFLGDSYEIISANVDSNASGIVIFNFAGVLTTLHTMKSKLSKWNEELEIVFPEAILKIILPPALQRNVPATVIFETGENSSKKEVYREEWSWSFMRQAIDFVSNVKEGKIEPESANSSLKDMLLIEDIYKHNLN